MDYVTWQFRQLFLKDIVGLIILNVNTFIVFGVEPNCYIIRVWKMHNLYEDLKIDPFSNWFLYKHVRFYKFVQYIKICYHPVFMLGFYVYFSFKFDHKNCSMYILSETSYDLFILYILVLGYALKLLFIASYHCFICIGTYLKLICYCYSYYLFSVSCIKIIVFYIYTNKW